MKACEFHGLPGIMAIFRECCLPGDGLERSQSGERNSTSDGKFWMIFMALMGIPVVPLLRLAVAGFVLTSSKN